ncbi:hypothetical protein KY348_02990 [Candidatus Woesearchaeota archaeon]|nr:hypothetical protein [Candidatus Woesearchaeota archaeon]
MNLEKRIILPQEAQQYNNPEGIILNTQAMPITKERNKIIGADGYTISSWSTPTIEEKIKEKPEKDSKKRPGWLKTTALATTLALSIFGSTITKPLANLADKYFFKEKTPPIMQTLKNADFGMTGCKGNPTDPNDPEPEPVQVNLAFAIYNHMTGDTGKMYFKDNVWSESTLTIKMSDLTNLGVKGVDDKRLILYSDGFIENLGFSNTGELSIEVPRYNTKYNLVLPQALQPPATYDWVDNQNAQLLKNKRHYIVYRADRDGQPPANWDSRFNFDQEAPWKEAFDQHNRALNRGWIIWGSITRRPNGTSGDFSYGYSDCRTPDGKEHMGLHGSTFVTVNAKILTSYEGFLRIGNSEIFENVTGTYDMGGGAGSWEKMTDDNGNLNYTGECLLAYVFAKDRASMNLN